MLEATVHFTQIPNAIYPVDPNGPLPEQVAERQRQKEKMAADAARQNDEQLRMQQLLESLQQVAGQLKEQKHELLYEMQQLTVELAVAVASQAIYTKIQAGDFPIEALVQAAIKRVSGDSPIIVRLHPDDLALLNRRMQGTAGSTLGTELRFEPDATLSRGDCRADTAAFGIWCRMQNQLEQMREKIMECLGDAEIERRKTAAGDSGLRRFPDRRQTA